MDPMEEPDEDLLNRHKHVNELIAEKTKVLLKMKEGGAKDRLARQIGSYEFTLLQIKSKMRDRNLKENK